MTIADRVKQRMRELGWVKANGQPNVAQFQERSGLGYATAHGLVTGSTPAPSLATLEKAAKKLRTTVQWLTGHEEGFDLRAYELGREDVAKAVRDAIDGVLATPPASGDVPAARARESLEEREERERKALARRKAGKGTRRA